MIKCGYIPTNKDCNEAFHYLEFKKSREKQGEISDAKLVSNWLKLHLKWNIAARDHLSKYSIRRRSTVCDRKKDEITERSLNIINRSNTNKSNQRTYSGNNKKQTPKKVTEQGIKAVKIAAGRISRKEKMRKIEEELILQAYAYSTENKSGAINLTSLLYNGSPFKFNSSRYIAKKTNNDS